MSETKQNREEMLFETASQKLDPSERRAFLDTACHEDPALRARLELLLEGHFLAEGFLIKSPERAAMPIEPPPPDPPSPVIGRYKLLEKIGEGGFGEVWMAEQKEPVRRRVAIKILKLGMDTRQVVRRFETERQALALMDHPNIARVLDAGATDSGRPYFVMDLVRGIRITDYCDQNNLSPKERLDLFIPVCQAIQHAHQKGIIHRDIKPSNILVTSHDGVPVPKVIDFGIAKATQQELTDKTLFTQFQQFIGTPAYVSPEQAGMSGLDIDTRSDIYSLGVLLYELLVGRTPFDAKELMSQGIDAMRQTIREQEPMRPSTKLSQSFVAANVSSLKSPATGKPATEEEVKAASRRLLRIKETITLLRGDLDWIVMKCLEKDRTRRYDTATGLVMDLKHHLAHEPVEARPPNRLYRLQKLVRRNKLTFAAGLAVATALILGLAVSSWQMIVAQHARKVAETEQERADAQARQASESRQQARRLLYVSDMNLAGRANLGQARRLLDGHRPQPGEEDLRGWEWRYLWQQTRSGALATLTNRQLRGWSASLSPDGNHLAVGWASSVVDLWDVPGRRRVRILPEREYDCRGAVAFSPVRNLLAASSEPSVVGLYDLDSGQESVLWRGPTEVDWCVLDLAFSQDGSKLVIYTMSLAAHSAIDTVLVVDVSSAKVECSQLTSHTPTGYTAARLSPDNRRLYLSRSEFPNHRYTIRCLDLATGKELWETEPQRDYGLTAMAVSPDGRVLASGSGFEVSKIRIWDATTGRLLNLLTGHNGWVAELLFSRDGMRLISAADESIRFWDTNTWLESKVLRGHRDSITAMTISEDAGLIASVDMGGNLMLWRDEPGSATDGFRRLNENLRAHEVLVADHSRVLLLPPGQPPELLDLNRDSAPVSLPELGSSTNALGWSAPNILCHWDGTNQLLIRELHGTDFIHRGAVVLDSGLRPLGAAFNTVRQLLAWTDGASSASVYVTNLSAPGPRIELKSDVPGCVPLRFSEDGNYLVAFLEPRDVWLDSRRGLRAWKIETGQLVASVDGLVRDFAFAAGGRVLVVATGQIVRHEIEFHDLLHPEQAPRRIPGKERCRSLSVSPDGKLVAPSATTRFMDSARWIRRASLALTVCLVGFLMPARGQQDPLITNTNHPMATNVSVGATVSFRVYASSTNQPMTYQWQHNGINLPVATNWTLLLTNVTVAHAGGYTAWITNAIGGFTNSRTAMLTVDQTFVKITSGAIVTDREPSDRSSWCDYDGDGFQDLFVANQYTGSGGKNSLYHNNRDGTFTKITTNALSATAGAWATGAWADVDNDGDPDIYVGGVHTFLAVFYRNDGGGRFTAVTIAPTLDAAGRDSWLVAWGDYDNDGWVDLFIPTGTLPSHRLFRNLGDLKFKSMTAAEVGDLVNPNSHEASPLATWIDYDNDGDLDIYLRQDPHFALHLNSGSGFFTRTFVGSIANVTDPNGNVKLPSWADYDNDGYLDAFISRPGFAGTLHHNLGGTNSVVVPQSGLEIPADNTAAIWGDYDNDGNLDLFLVNNPRWPSVSVRGANLLFRGNGDGTFTQVDVGSPIWEGSDEWDCNWIDYDNDGFPDLFIAAGPNVPEVNYLYRNNLPATGNTNHWLKVSLVGKASNASGIGAKVRVTANIRGQTVTQLRAIESPGYIGSNQGLLAHFGLGDATNVTTLRIEWPSGIVQELHDVAVDQFLPPVVESQGYTNAAPQFSGATKDASGSQLSFTEPAAGARYILEASTNLVTWTKLLARTSTGVATNYTDTRATNYPSRFYRLQVP